MCIPNTDLLTCLSLKNPSIILSIYNPCITGVYYGRLPTYWLGFPSKVSPDDRHASELTFFFCACICPLNIAMPQTNGKNLKTWDYSPLNPDKPIYSQHLLRCLIDRGVVLDGSYPLREAARRHGPHESANLSSIGLGKWPNISPTWKVRLHSSELAVRSWKKKSQIWVLVGPYSCSWRFWGSRAIFWAINSDPFPIWVLATDSENRRPSGNHHDRPLHWLWWT